MDDFAQALRSVGEPIFGKDATEVSMARVLLQLFDITRQFGMHLRPELILLQKTMVQVEGVARSIDPGHNIWQAAKPIVDRWTPPRVRARGAQKLAHRDRARGARAVAPAARDAAEAGRGAEQRRRPRPCPGRRQADERMGLAPGRGPDQRGFGCGLVVRAD